ncbi:hypothetical protein LSTR_LSTR013679 [Laodelphax striatellus]|uniref:Uncharacterized protein n=1 Tax=Laodelphax striatellus TaxID=195883 RepID=A0A482XG26_LAOST|nr:hypothetical protein LSTR_LSTR013679 [Laodelphax striatellus]
MAMKRAFGKDKQSKEASAASALLEKSVKNSNLNVDAKTEDTEVQGKKQFGKLLSSSSLNNGGKSGGSSGGGGGIPLNALNSFVTRNKLQAGIRQEPGVKGGPGGPGGWKSLLSNALKNLQKGKIPLLLAVEAGNQSMCRELLAQQTADQLRATTENGDTALHLAARRRDVDMVRILVDYGANDDGQTPLHIASAEGDETLVKYFYGVRASASIADRQDRTPMHLAAENVMRL